MNAGCSIISRAVHGCTNAAGAWMRRSGHPGLLSLACPRESSQREGPPGWREYSRASAVPGPGAAPTRDPSRAGQAQTSCLRPLRGARPEPYGARARHTGAENRTHLAVAVHRCFRPADSTHTARPNGFCSHPRLSEPSTAAPPRGVARLLFEPEARFISARRVRRALGGARSAGDRALCARRSDRGGLSFGDFSLAAQRKVTCRGSATHK